jgi:hypothetical protein
MAATVVDPHVVAAAAQDRQVLGAIEALLNARGETVRLVSGGASVEVPPALIRLLAECVRSLGHDHAVVLLPQHGLLSLEEAADILNVPRVNASQVLAEAGVEVIDADGEGPVRAEQVLAYANRLAATRLAALSELVAIGQEIQPERADA